MAPVSTASAHTPGSWFFNPTHLVVFDAAVKLGVATVHDWNNRDEAIANGRLIAAAPELLEVLHILREWCDMPDVWVDQRDKVAAVLDAAIGKAEGRG